MTFVPHPQEFRDTRRAPALVDGAVGGTRLYRIGKRGFDLVFSTILLLPAMLLVAAALLVLNPVYNPGPLFFSQRRMGRDCRPFTAIKFRTMVCAGGARSRGHDDPLEADRITRVGRFLRRSRFDELPQILNVYLGQMSLIGPRPDFYDHASAYLLAVPGYRDRHRVLPGISGLAQIQLGYAEGIDDTRLKTAADIDYARRAGLRLDAWIFWQTVRTVWEMRGT